MTIALVFWIIMLLWLLFGFVGDRLGAWAGMGGTLLLFILLLLLGWHVFGAPIHG